MRILLTNDDGIHAPGLAAMESELQAIGEVTVIAPQIEQSGVSHTITYLTPLTCRQVYDGERQRGWAVDGSPADCVKLAVSEFFDKPPDLIVSGINGGLNCGINILYSGTVAAAIEGAFFGIPSIAVSMERERKCQFELVAPYARQIIEKIIKSRDPNTVLFNLNFPTAAVHSAEKEVLVVPMGVRRHEGTYVRRETPGGDPYFWATLGPPPEPTELETDITALRKGYVTLTPLDYDLTKQRSLEMLRQCDFSIA